MDRSEEFRKKQEAKRKAEQHFAEMMMDDYEDKVRSAFALQAAEWEKEKAAKEAEEARRVSYGEF